MIDDVIFEKLVRKLISKVNQRSISHSLRILSLRMLKRLLNFKPIDRKTSLIKPIDLLLPIDKFPLLLRNEII